LGDGSSARCSESAPTCSRRTIRPSRLPVNGSPKSAPAAVRIPDFWPLDAQNGPVIESGRLLRHGLEDVQRPGERVGIGIGVKVQNSGPRPEQRGIGAMAAELEAAGFESLWVSDHIVLPAEIASRYPFAEDGRATWATNTPYFDALIALALIAQATERATIGTAVLVLPL